MTDAQIERIARLWCVKMGYDPDAMYYGLDKQGVLWEIKSEDVRAAITLWEAIKEVG